MVRKVFLFQEGFYNIDAVPFAEISARYPSLHTIVTFLPFHSQFSKDFEARQGFEYDLAKSKNVAEVTLSGNGGGVYQRVDIVLVIPGKLSDLEFLKEVIFSETGKGGESRIFTGLVLEGRKDFGGSEEMVDFVKADHTRVAKVAPTPKLKEDPIEAVAIPPAVMTFSTLEELDIPIIGMTIPQINDLTLHLPGLRSLSFTIFPIAGDVESTWDTEEGQTSLIQSLVENCPQLTRVSLRAFVWRVPLEKAMVILGVGLPNLQSLTLPAMNRRDDGAEMAPLVVPNDIGRYFAEPLQPARFPNMSYFRLVLNAVNYTLFSIPVVNSTLATLLPITCRVDYEDSRESIVSNGEFYGGDSSWVAEQLR